MKNLFRFSIALGFCLILFEAGAQVYLSENFNSVVSPNLPTGWIVENNSTGNNVDQMAFQTQTAPYTYGGTQFTMNGGGFVMSNGDIGGSGCSQNTSLTTPSFNAANASLLYFEFSQFYRDYSATATDSAVVEVFNGTSWVLVQGLDITTGSGTAPEVTRLNITDYKNANMKIRFRSMGAWPWFWAFDNVRVFQPISADIGVSKILLRQDTCGFGTNIPVKVEIKNFGSAPQGNFQVSYSINGGSAVNQLFNGQIVPDATAEFTFSTIPTNVNVGNNYITAWTNLPTDGFEGNDTVKNFQILSAAPDLALVSFEGYNGDNIGQLEPGWSEKSGIPPAGSTALWRPSSIAQTTAFNTTTAAINLYTASRKEWLISPVFKPNANSSLTYRVGLTNWQTTETDIMGSDDSVHVMISSNCGLSWQRLKSYSQSSNLSNTLINQVVPLTPYIGQEVRIAILANDGAVDDPEDYDFHIDNIRVGDVSNQIDLSVLSIEGSGLCGLATLERFKVRVSNLGPGNAQQYAVAYRVNNGDVFSANVITPLVANDTSIVEIPSPYLSPGQNYQIKFWSKNGSDENFSNDTLRLTLRRDSISTDNISFTGFNGNNMSVIYPGWTEATKGGTNIVNGSWRAGDVDGQIAARINLSGTNKSDWILSTGIKIAPQSYLTFKAAILNPLQNDVGTFGTDDSVTIFITQNCGANWVKLLTFSQSSLNSITRYLNNYSIPLFGYADSTVEARLGIQAKDGTSSAVSSFFYIDDIQITNLINHDAAADTVYFTNPSLVQGDSTNFNVVVNNNGISPINFVKVQARFGAFADSIMIPKILPGQSSTVTFLNYVPEFSGSFEGLVYLSTSGDQVNLNDTIRKPYTVLVSSKELLTGSESWQIFPNPSRDVLSVLLSPALKNQISSVSIFDLRGALVKNYAITHEDEIRLSLKDLDEGIYQVKLFTRSGRQTGPVKKLLKN